MKDNLDQDERTRYTMKKGIGKLTRHTLPVLTAMALLMGYAGTVKYFAQISLQSR